MPQISLPDRGSLFYEEHGKGEPLLLVPGLGGEAGFWSRVVPHLAERYRVILHDHRGTGRSSIDRIDYSIGQMSADVLALMDHLKIERASLIGHSTGGAIGQTLALDHPGRLNHLVLSATWTKADAYFKNLFSVRANILRTAGAGEYLRSTAILLNPPWWVRDHPEIAEISDEAAAARIPDPQIVLDRITAILRHDRSEELNRIAVPTLVIGARDDMVTPFYFSKELKGRIPSAKLILISEGGHTFPITRSETFLNAALEFLPPPRL